jgi:hypothetical protein
MARSLPGKEVFRLSNAEISKRFNPTLYTKKRASCFGAALVVDSEVRLAQELLCEVAVPVNEPKLQTEMLRSEKIVRLTSTGTRGVRRRVIWFPRRLDRPGVFLAIALRRLPVHTITFDNGIEFGHHKAIEKLLKCKVYFTDVNSPQQRGSNENLNGLIGEFFPKGESHKPLPITAGARPVRSI